jgi:mRNA interferase HigB
MSTEIGYDPVLSRLGCARGEDPGPISQIGIVSQLGEHHILVMHVIARSTLLEYASRHAETRDQLSTWYRTTSRANWRMMIDVISAFPTAAALNAERARFKICGNSHRLIVSFKFSAQIVWVKFIGTHAEYDKIDALTVSQF